MSDAVFSIDVELFRQTPAYRNAGGSTDRADAGLDGLRFLREALAKHDATATCFVVSSVAQSHPEAIEALATEGHEIGSHTHSHELLSELDPGRRREELARSREILETETGADVAGFRAPAFDIPPDHFRDLADAGYEYDASVVPSRRIPGWYGGEYSLSRPAPARAVDPDAPGELAELPTSVMPGLRLPLTGTWLRFFGPQYTMLGMRWLARRGIAPVLYVHPWELVDLPAVEGVPRRVYWRTGGWMRRAVERILAQPFEFVPAREVVAAAVGDRTDGNAPTGGGRDRPAAADGRPDGEG
jgi:peptidoglycan/xylan/chitin deacetylase (PgdA/CDA1 family)